MLVAAALRDLIKRRLFRDRSRPLTEVSSREWQISPPEETLATGAYFLPGQIDRIMKTAFLKGDPRRLVTGGYPVVHSATRAFQFEDVLLLDGVLYKNGAAHYLTPRRGKVPVLSLDAEVEHAALYCTIPGLKYFGHWLLDDCSLYPLAAAEGDPTTLSGKHAISHLNGSHGPLYEKRFGMEPLRLDNTFIRKLVLFDDLGQNSHKSRRFGGLRTKLLAPLRDVAPHPGVFMIRGDSGERRVLKNELAIADYLESRRGFRTVDVMSSDVDTLMQVCAGARVIVGTEGSHLIHGLMLMSAGGALLTIQPPKRFCLVYKDLADRERIKFGFVVGSPDGESFTADPVDIERTLDLLA